MSRLQFLPVLAALIAWTFGAESSAPVRPREEAKLLATYSPAFETVEDVSEDGKLILTSSRILIRCADSAAQCWVVELAVHEVGTGKRLAATRSPADGGTWILSAAFTGGRTAVAIESITTKAYTCLAWNYRLGTVERWRFDLGAPVPEACEHLGRSEPSMRFQNGSWRAVAGGLTGDGSELSQPEHLSSIVAVRDEWRSGDTYLLPGGDTRPQGSEHQGSSLYWISAMAGIPYRKCWDAGDRKILSYALSPDRTRIAVVTGAAGPWDGSDTNRFIYSPEMQLFLNVLDGVTCEQLHRSELHVPDKPNFGRTIFGNRPGIVRNGILEFSSAALLTISPDNALLVLAYGQRTDDETTDSTARFGIYSLEAGRHLATLEGDKYRNGILRRLFYYFDDVVTSRAPIRSVHFSPDSNSVLLISSKARLWDLRGLRTRIP